MASSELNERSTCVEAFSFSTNKAFVRTSSAAAYLASLCQREDFSQGRFLFLLLNQSLEIAEILFHSSRQTGDRKSTVFSALSPFPDRSEARMKRRPT